MQAGKETFSADQIRTHRLEIPMTRTESLARARDIRKKFAEGVPAMDLAKAYNLGLSTVYRIVNHEVAKEPADA